MSRCECAALSFQQIAALAERDGITEFELLCGKTGCASTCTACLPDLQAFLAARARTSPTTCVTGSVS